MTTAYSVTPFINVLVWVKKKETEDGYDVHCEPNSLKVLQRDTVINYQIVDTYGQDIVFSGLEVKPEGQDQLSNAAISVSGKQLTVSDANTQKCCLNLYLEFTDNTLSRSFIHDPQVHNETSQ